ncbi:hypothetical protein BFJ67_g18223 [Fusarium oxysporum f. sp. cepae]|nr:hypothetical protein BFJ67_g18223 [Fusarium oxysporum f. sp. cepae]
MASSTTIPPAALDPFDLGIHTPVNLNNPNSPDQAHRESAESYSSLVLMTGNRYSQTRKNDRKPLRIFQANVGKIPPAHDCALQTCLS